MPVTSTPVWDGAQAGLVGNAGAIAASAQVNQLLGTHPDQPIYQGTLAPNGGVDYGGGGVQWGLQLATQDIDEPVQLTGTSIGKVLIPLLCVGNGADLLVSLCADNAGAPGTVITQTRIPASWIYQHAAIASVSVPSTQPPVLQYTNNPLAVAQYNSFHIGPQTTTPWPYPTPGPGGPATFSCSTCFGNYFIQMGGLTGTTYYNNVYTIGFDNTGNVSQAVPQSPLPVATSGFASAVVATDSSGNSTVVFAGGTTAGNTITNAVFTAGFDSATGTVVAWTTQTVLPVALSLVGMATYNSYVYAVGGENGSNAMVNTVYYAQMSNGQLGAWATSAPLPESVGGAYVFAVDGFLIVFGGILTVTPTYSSACYWAPINANGSLGAWRAGPTLPQVTALNNGNVVPSAGNYGLITNGNSTIFQLGVTANGLDVTWRTGFFSFAGSYYAVANAGDGLWRYYGLTSTNYYTLVVALTPMIPVPLPATGLTNGATYHVLMQQQGGDLNNYLRTHLDNQALGGTPTLQTSPRNTYTWTTATPAQTQVPLELWDATDPGNTMHPAHTWEDNGARISSLIYATTPDRRLLGIIEATRIGLGLNANQGFEAGVSPWTVTGGALAQSTAQSYAGAHSAQVTPSGSASLVYLTSENLPCLPGQSITASAWMWFTSAVTGNASISVNWFASTGAGGGYISTSSNPASVPAGTWTQLTNTFTAPPGAYQFTINPTLDGTPASAQIWYVDDVLGFPTYSGAQLSSTIQIPYGGVWPSPGTFPPLGTVQLA
jgi:hypothetical protein